MVSPVLPEEGNTGAPLGTHLPEPEPKNRTQEQQTPLPTAIPRRSTKESLFPRRSLATVLRHHGNPSSHVDPSTLY